MSDPATKMQQSLRRVRELEERLERTRQVQDIAWTILTVSLWVLVITLIVDMLI